MDQRVEQILVDLAYKYRPELLQTWDRSGDYSARLPQLARALANYHILVIMGDFPYSLQALSQAVNEHIDAWVNTYGELYLLLAYNFTPSSMKVRAHYVDTKWPVVIYIKGDSAAVIQMLAGYVAPYIAERQMSPVVSEAELGGLMNLILGDLDPSHLSWDQYRDIHTQGVAILRKMLATQIRQLPLTNFDREIFTDSQRIVPVSVPPPPLKLPEQDLDITRTDIRAQPAAYNPTDTAQLNSTQNLPPTTLPQETPAEPPAQRESLFESPLPVFFARKEGTAEIKKRSSPPVMRPPKR